MIPTVKVLKTHFLCVIGICLSKSYENLKNVPKKFCDFWQRPSLWVKWNMDKVSRDSFKKNPNQIAVIKIRQFSYLEKLLWKSSRKNVRENYLTCCKTISSRKMSFVALKTIFHFQGLIFLYSCCPFVSYFLS